MPDRNIAIVNAHSKNRYSQNENAQVFDIHYATVNRIVKI